MTDMDEVKGIMEKVFRLIDTMIDTLRSHKECIENLSVRINNLNERLNAFDSTLYNHKENIEILQKEVYKEYNFTNNKEKVYKQ